MDNFPTEQSSAVQPPFRLYGRQGETILSAKVFMNQADQSLRMILMSVLRHPHSVASTVSYSLYQTIIKPLMAKLKPTNFKKGTWNVRTLAQTDNVKIMRKVK